MTASDWTTFGKTSGGGGTGGAFFRPNKLKDGQGVKFRILGSPLEGFERWTVAKKPVLARFGEAWPDGHEWRPGKEGAPRLFGAMPIYNYADDAVQVFAFTQGGIRDAIAAYVANEDYGIPTGYDMTLSRKGTGMDDTKYTLVASPPKAPADKVVAAWTAVLEKGFDLDELFRAGNPFEPDASIPF